MTRQEAIEFAVSSARMACDAWGDYGSLQSSIDAHRENIRDTLNDLGSSDHEVDAWVAFDTEVRKLCA